MNGRSLAHLSDLHIGRSRELDLQAVMLCRTLLRSKVNHVVITGDVTHRGRQEELRRFEELFAPLRRQGRLTVVPGNHDRLGDDIGVALVAGERVRARAYDGLYLVSIDSTGPHNRSLIASHGALCERVLSQVDDALSAAPDDALVVLLLHHHVLPMPEESLSERLASLIGRPYASELPLGLELLQRAVGRADLVLHGHRHVPRSFELDIYGARPLQVFNAGSSTELGRFRLFTHARGKLLGEPQWVEGETSGLHVAPRPAHALARLGAALRGHPRERTRVLSAP